MLRGPSAASQVATGYLGVSAESARPRSTRVSGLVDLAFAAQRDETLLSGDGPLRERVERFVEVYLVGSLDVDEGVDATVEGEPLSFTHTYTQTHAHAHKHTHAHTRAHTRIFTACLIVVYVVLLICYDLVCIL